MEEKLWPLPVRNLFSVGHATAERLEKISIKTIGDLAKTDLKWVQNILGKKLGEQLHHYANGIDSSPVLAEPEEAKGVGNSTTLSEDATTYEEARDVFRELAQSVGSRLKKAGKKAGMVSMEVRYYDFRNMSHQVQLQKPTNDPVILCETACNLFRESWSGEPVRLLGIRTSKLVEENAPEQLTIFDIELPKEPDEKHKKLNAALEQLNNRYGKGAVVKGTFYKPDGNKKKDENQKR